MVKFYFYVFLVFIGSISCQGLQSLVECPDGEGASGVGQCVPQSDDEKAVLAMNSGDYSSAQELLEALIAAEPEVYIRYPRLATVYALQGGVDLLEIAQSQSSGESSGSGLDSIGAFLPEPDPDQMEDYTAKVTKVGLAKDTLNRIPAAELLELKAKFQLSIYQSAYSVMYMNQFVIPVSPGSNEISAESLENLTPEAALVILSNLRSSSSNIAEEDPEAAEKIDAVLEQIDAQEGGSDDEKLQEFLKAQNS
ncbi:MAG: hypothetical protein AB8C84_10415 [Oligoflexales bacterium]